MHPIRPSDSSGNQSRQRRATPSTEHGRYLTESSLHQSLPSIRQLHPYLLPSGMSQHPQAGEGSNLNFPLPSVYNQPDINDQPSLSRSQVREGVDSEPEGDPDHHGPPKKKRRRQALSCTGDASAACFMACLLMVILLR